MEEGFKKLQQRMQWLLKETERGWPMKDKMEEAWFLSKVQEKMFLMHAP